MEHIGFIGLGVMGRPMALNLLKAGYEVTVYDISAQQMEALAAAGALTARSCREVARACEVVITMLPNSPDVHAAITGRDGVLEGAGEGSIIVDMSSISPRVSKELAAVCAAKKVTYLDCPVSGGEPKAVDGTLAIMCGGPTAVFDHVKPMLMCMGASVELIGEAGSGNMAKLANQIIVAVNIAAIGEAFVLLKKSGVDCETVFKAIRGGLAGSNALNAKAPMMLAHQFAPGFRIDLHIKDLMNAMDAAEAADAPLPLSTAVIEMLQTLSAKGDGGLDHSALLKHYEALADVII